MMLPMQPPEEPKGDWNAKRVLGVLKRRWHIVSGIAILVSTYLISGSLSVTPGFQGRFRMLIEPVNAGNEISGLTPGGDSSLDYDTQIQVLQSPELIGEVIKALQPQYPGLSYGEIVGNLKINRVGSTKILEVQYQGGDGQKMQAVLEQTAKTYLEYSLSQRQTYLRQGIQFVEKQLPVNQRRVDQLQRQLQAFRQNNYFLDPDSQAERLTGLINSADQQRADIDKALTLATADLASNQQEAGLITTLNQSGNYQSLIGQIRSVEVQIAQELTRFGPNSLSIRVLQEKRNNLLPLLQKEAQTAVGGKVAALVTQIQSLQIQREVLDQSQIQLYQSFQKLPVLSRQYTDLQRELQVATESLSRFLAARENLQIRASQSEIPWQIVEPPTISGVAPPDQKRDLMRAIAIGLGVGLLVAILLEQLAHTYQTVDDLKKKVSLPILGQIPFQRQLRHARGRVSIGQSFLRNLSNIVPTPVAPEVVLSNDMRFAADRNSLYGTSSFVEAFRILYTNLQTRNLDQPIRSIIVSSAAPGDGKTTIAVQLAQTIAALGKRVLLVDADLRRPAVHNQLQLQNHQGLFEVVTANLPLREALQHPAHLPLCQVLPAGRFPNDPTQIIASPSMQACMESFLQIADLVIYDAPPLGGLADASILAPHVDGILFVVGLGKTNQTVLNETLENLKIAQVPILGIVCNSLSA
jgi:polysaccharide biosynthesis transport protein